MLLIVIIFILISAFKHEEKQKEYGNQSYTCKQLLHNESHLRILNKPSVV